VASAQTRAFDTSDLDAAAVLLAARHRQHRMCAPTLDQRFEDAAACVDELAKTWQPPASSGAVALDGVGRPVGYLVGTPRTAPVWGPNIWVESAGQATRDAELMRDLYAFAATRWVAEGRTAHYVIVPATDEPLVNAWFRLGFGQQQAHAVRPLTPVPDARSDVTVRRAERRDIAVLAALDLVLPEHQEGAPVFSAGNVPTLAEAEDEWHEAIDDERFATFVAEIDGDVIGSATGCAVSLSSMNAGLIRPSNAGYLGYAAVFPDARARGVGRSLAARVIEWCSVAGFDCAAVDWRVTNLLAARAWTSLGFEPTFLRLHRHIGY
jgi:ribosomal protein S18 acetylase RimI-like enzyme